MKPDLVRLTRLHEWITYLLSAVVFISGIAWLYFFYFVRIEGEYGFEMHPMTNISLVAHGLSALCLLVVLGTLLPIHIARAWRLKKNRTSGAFFFSVFFLLIISGMGLYYLGNEKAQNFASVFHWGLGLLFPILLGWHIYMGKRKK